MKVLLVLILAACAPHANTQPRLDPVPDAGDPPAHPDAPDLSPPNALAHCNAGDPRSTAPILYATPEAGEQPYVDSLMSATQSIRVEIYEMGYGGILTALIAKAQAGVPVQVIMDKSEISTNQKYFDQLTSAGAQVIWSDPQFTYLHAKFFVVDLREAVISTGNYSLTYSIQLERNFLAVLDDPADVADLVSLFDADWNRAVPDMSCTRMILSPINSDARILALIQSAQKTLTIEEMQFADSDVRAAVQERQAAGVAIRAILADPVWITANADAATFLKGLDIPVKNIPHMHTKVLVVDGNTAFVGSENLSYTSLHKNREVGIITSDASSLQPLTDTFEKDWAAGVDF